MNAKKTNPAMPKTAQAVNEELFTDELGEPELIVQDEEAFFAQVCAKIQSRQNGERTEPCKPTRSLESQEQLDEWVKNNEGSKEP